MCVCVCLCFKNAGYFVNTNAGFRLLGIHLWAFFYNILILPRCWVVCIHFISFIKSLLH